MRKNIWIITTISLVFISSFYPIVIAETINIQYSETPNQKIYPLSDPSDAVWFNTDKINAIHPKSPYYGKVIPQERFPSGERAVHYSWGAKWDGSFDEGAFAYQEIHGDLELGDGGTRTLYAPTVTAPAPCPLESVTAYWDYTDMETSRNWAVFTWNKTYVEGVGYTNWPKVFPYEEFGDFTETVSGREFYYTDIVNNFDDTWSVYLWNFTLNNWQGIITVSEVESSPRQNQDGWNVWESITWSTDWPNMPEIRSDYLMIYNGASWVYCTYFWGGRLYDNLPGNFDEPKTWNDYYYDWKLG